MSRQLFQYCRSIPLNRLKQGGTLSIQAKLPVTRLELIPKWRDDGILKLIQWTSKVEADVSIKQDLEKMTSLGRLESHVQVSIFPREAKTNDNVSTATKRETSATISDTLLQKVEEPLVITDDGDVQPDSEKWQKSNVKRVEYPDGITHVSEHQSQESTTTTSQEPSLNITCIIPEKCNLTCELLEGGDIIVEKKVEGDVHLHTTNGDIAINKLRGHEISISALGKGNTILATDLMEAQKLSIETRGRVRAKKIHGSNVNITVDRQDDDDNASFTPTNDVDDEESLVDISSMYVAGNGSANVRVSSNVAIPDKRAVRIKSHHGHVNVETSVPFPNTSPCVELGGVNGSFDVTIQSPIGEDHSSMAGRIHVDSLSSDSISVLSATAGDVSLTLDRKAEADLRLLSSNKVSLFDSRTELLEDDDPDRLQNALRDLDAKSEQTMDKPRISIETNAFTPRTTETLFHNIDYMDGWVENKSNEPDCRFDLMSKGGKIRLQGAAEQALQGFSSSKQESDVSRPLVAVATNGKIVLESLSWFGAIARRYGLEEERDDLGRTAKRSGRPLRPKE